MTLSCRSLIWWVLGYKGLWRLRVGDLVTVWCKLALEVGLEVEVAVQRPVFDCLEVFEKPDVFCRPILGLLAEAVVGLVRDRMSVFSRSVPGSFRLRSCCRVP
jgi:hypothetical protein